MSLNLLAQLFQRIDQDFDLAGKLAKCLRNAGVALSAQAVSACPLRSTTSEVFECPKSTKVDHTPHANKSFTEALGRASTVFSTRTNSAACGRC